MVCGPRQFDSTALFAAIDEKRLETGLKWTQLAKQTGVSAGTIKGLQLNRTSYELDGILFLTQWLGRSIEEFTQVPVQTRGDIGMPYRRFDSPALFAAINSERERRALAWSEVSTETGVLGARLIRMAEYRRFTVAEVLGAAQWLQRPIGDFTRIGPPPEQLLKLVGGRVGGHS